MLYVTESHLLSPTTCLLVGGPMSPSGLQLNQEDSFSLSTHFLQKDAKSDRPGNAHLGPPHQRWRRDVLQHLELFRDQPTRDTCVHIPTGGLRCVSWNTRGLLVSTASSQRSREQKHIYLTRLFCQAYDGTMGSKLPRRHCPFSSARCGCLHCFSLMCFCLPTRLSSRCFPSFLA